MTATVATSREIPVEHVRIASEKPFDEVRNALEAMLPPLDPGIPALLRNGDTAGAADFALHGPKLSIFLTRDHGALLSIFGGPRKALQYEIGNPLTASTMTRYQLPAALYAPLRVVLYEDPQGRGVFEYDRPSALFGQFGDDRVTAVGHKLDAELDAALRWAAA